MTTSVVEQNNGSAVVGPMVFPVRNTEKVSV